MPTGRILSEAREWVSVARASKQGAAGRARPGWAELREARWDAARAAFEETLAREETPEAFEGLSWAAWWLDDAEAVFEARERAYRLYRKSGDAASAARMATWLAADQLDFHGAWAVASGWLRRAHRLLDPLEPGPEHGWLAFHEGYLAHARATPRQRASRAIFAAELGRRFGVADLEMLGLALEGAALVAGAEVDGGDALPRRGDGDRARGRGDDPDLERLGVLLPRHRVHGGARLRARVRVVRPDRRVRGALREPLHARVLPGRVRRGPPLARPVGGGRDAARGLARGLLSLAPRMGGRAAGRAGRAAAAAGQVGGGGALLDQRGRVAERRSSAARAWRSTEARRSAPSSSLERLLRQIPAEPQARPRSRARAARPRPDRARRARRGRRRRSRRCGRSNGWSARRRSSVRRSGRGHAGGRRRRPRPRADAARGRVDRFERSGAPFEAAWRGSSWRRACSRSAAPMRPSGRRRGLESLVEPGREAEAERARRLLSTRPAAPVRSRRSRRGSGRCCVCSRKGSRTGRSPSGWS